MSAEHALPGDALESYQMRDELAMTLKWGASQPKDYTTNRVIFHSGRSSILKQAKVCKSRSVPKVPNTLCIRPSRSFKKASFGYCMSRGWDSKAKSSQVISSLVSVKRHQAQRPNDSLWCYLTRYAPETCGRYICQCVCSCHVFAPFLK